jgi:hypothetical protein
MYTRTHLEALKVVDLKEILRSAGQKVSGHKADLIDRILAAKLSAPTKSPRGKSSKKKAPSVKIPAGKNAKKTTAPHVHGTSRDIALTGDVGQRIAAQLARSQRKAGPRVTLSGQGNVASSTRRSGQISPVPQIRSPGARNPYEYIPEERVNDLELIPWIKSVLYFRPHDDITTQMAQTGPDFLDDLVWDVANKLFMALLRIEDVDDELLADDPDADLVPLTDEFKRNLNRQYLASSIYVSLLHIDNPNASEERPYRELIEFESTDAYPLTQWQLLKGLEQYYQHYTYLHGRRQMAAYRTGFAGVVPLGTRNGIPIYKVVLG